MYAYVSDDPPCKEPDSNLHIWNFYLINSKEDTVFFLGLKVSNSDNSRMLSGSRNALVTIVEKKKQLKHW